MNWRQAQEDEEEQMDEVQRMQREDEAWEKFLNKLDRLDKLDRLERLEREDNEHIPENTSGNGRGFLYPEIRQESKQPIYIRESRCGVGCTAPFTG